jgi:hypothetical protein
MSRRLRPSPQARTAVSAEGAVLLHIGTGRCFKLNAFGACVWQRIVRGDSPSAIAGDILHAASVPEHVVKADLERLMSQLLANRLLEEEL